MHKGSIGPMFGESVRGTTLQVQPRNPGVAEVLGGSAYMG